MPQFEFDVTDPRASSVERGTSSKVCASKSERRTGNQSRARVE